MKEFSIFRMFKNDCSQGDLGTLANVVTSLGHLSKCREAMDISTDLSGIETMSNDDSVMTDIQRDEHNDVTRYRKTLILNLRPRPRSMWLFTYLFVCV